MAKEKKEKTEMKNVVETVGTRGRTFQGPITKKFPNRVVIEIERTVHVPKYERFYKKKTKLHARLPEGMDVSVGDIIRIRECRPLSKIIHFIVIEKVKLGETK